MGWIQIGFLGALSAAAIPIIIHLVFGRRARRVDLGTLRFLRIVLNENVRRRRVKRWLLLGLRMACAALLACLFARPYLVEQGPTDNDRLVVVLIDCSASMGLRTQRGRLLDLAVDQAREIVGQCSEGTEIRLAWFDSAVHPLALGTGGLDSPRERLEEPSDPVARLDPPQAAYRLTDYGAALAWASDLCVASERREKDVFLLTDLQRSGLDRTQAGPLPADVDIHLVAVNQPYPKNIAVTHAAVPKPVVRLGRPVTLTASLLNAGQFAVDGIPVIVHLRSGDRQQDRRAELDLEAGASGTVQFDLADLDEGLWQGYVMAEVRDDLPFDDRRHVAFLMASQIPVLLVDGEPGVSTLASETYFLEAALRLAAAGESFPESPFLPTVVAPGQSAELPEITDARVIVLANVGDFTTSDARWLAEFVDSGGGLLVFTGENVAAKGYGALEQAGLCPGRICGVRTASSLPWRLDQWEPEHPVFLPFNDPQTGDLQRIVFHSYTQIEPAQEVRVLARFSSGEPALLERRHGLGKILWFVSACDRQWSDWPRSRLFLPMVHQMLSYLAGMAQGGPVRYLPIEETNSNDRVAVPGVFAREGFHQVVNVDARESETDLCTPDEFAARFDIRWQSDDEPRVADLAPALGPAGELRDDEIWHWVLLVLFGALLVESVLGNRTPT